MDFGIPFSPLWLWSFCDFDAWSRLVFGFVGWFISMHGMGCCRWYGPLLFSNADGDVYSCWLLGWWGSDVGLSFVSMCELFFVGSWFGFWYGHDFFLFILILLVCVMTRPSECRYLGVYRFSIKKVSASVIGLFLVYITGYRRNFHRLVSFGKLQVCLWCITALGHCMWELHCSVCNGS